MKGRFFVIDGIGGLGKSTQIELLKKRLGKKALFTYEPGGTPHAEKLRTFLRTVDGPEPDPLMDFFLFWAARADHVAKKIRPALKKGMHVVSDRFDSSTFAMQIRGDRNSNWEHLFWMSRETALEGALPDAYILIDGPVALARSRRGSRSRTEDRFDERDDAYQNRIRKGYLEFAKKIGNRAHVLEAECTPQELHEKVWKIVQKVMRK